MIYSDPRKLTLAGWLRNNDSTSYNVPLKLQKFIFFYECACKVQGWKYSFDGLKGYKNGPVYSAVWGDYTRERLDFDSKADELYMSEVSTPKERKIINDDLISRIDFFIRTCTQQELSDITHEMNIWRSRQDRIESKERQVPLSDSDFNSRDEEMINNIISVYPPEIVENSEVIQISDTIFILSKEDANNLEPEQMDVLQELADSQSTDLENPVYISIDKEQKGRLLVD